MTAHGVSERRVKGLCLGLGWAMTLTLAGLACGPDPYVFELPPGFPEPPLPAERTLTVAEVELGRHLFYDERLSGNGTQSCASCHRQELAFTDGRARALGSTGELHRRGSMSLANVAYAATLTWANPLMDSLERQALVPLLGEAPVELGVSGREDEVLARLAADEAYDALFAQAYPGSPEPSLANVTRALGVFQRTLISGNSPYDRYFYRGEEDALSASARRGMALFFSERLECFHCHGGFNFSDSTRTAASTFTTRPFHNTALYSEDASGAYPAEDTGVHEVSTDAADMGRFKAPTLRNVTVTAPYMHDGSIATLEEVLDHYAAGGRAPDNPLKSGFMVGFTLTEQERADVLAFLESLTDEVFLTDPRFSNPFEP